MKTILCYSLSMLGLVLSSSAQGATLLKWDWENVPSIYATQFASYQCDCIDATAFDGNGHPTSINGVTIATDPNHWVLLGGWPTNDYAYSLERTDLTMAQYAAGFEFSTSMDASGGIDSVSFDVSRPLTGFSEHVTSIQAALFWEDASGQIQSASTGVVDLSGYQLNEWASFNLAFSHATSPLPTGDSFGGQSFLFELYASGPDGFAPLVLDNLSLNGSCAAVVPEPGGALLIACMGLLALSRRRSRR